MSTRGFSELWRRSIAPSINSASMMMRKKSGKRKMTATMRRKLQRRAQVSTLPPLSLAETKRNEFFIKCLDFEPKQKPEGDEEQFAQDAEIAREYQKRITQRRHIHRQDLQHKHLMKMLSVSALPKKEMQLDAVKVTDPTMPLSLRPPSYTPPHAGWQRPPGAVVGTLSDDDGIRDEAGFESEEWTDTDDEDTVNV